MHESAKSTHKLTQGQQGRGMKTDRIISLIHAGDQQAALGEDAEAICTYYTVFQPDLCIEPIFGLGRVAPIRLYGQAAKKLRLVASRHAEQLVDSGRFLAAESANGVVGVPRGALNLYLISNQYDVFAELALRYAAEELSRRDIKRFLMSSVRARLDHLHKVQACATLLEEEQNAFAKLADFEARLQAHLAPLHAKTGKYSHTRPERRSERRKLRYA